MTVGIVTDSTCDLPAATLLRLGVAAVPLKVIVDGVTYRDGRDLDPHDLYARMRDGGARPETQPPEPEEFVPVYRRFLGSYDEIVSIHLSGRLSRTLENARAAAAELGAEERIHFVDSGAATIALAEMVAAAAAEAAEGGDVEGVRFAAERIRESALMLFSPASLDWLVAGGRIGRARGMVGSLLGLRPILTMTEGEIALEATVRHPNALDAMLRRLEKRFGDTPVRVAIGYAGDDREEIERLKRRTERTSMNIVKGRVQIVGPAIGAHLGPGSTALCAYPDLGAVLDL